MGLTVRRTEEILLLFAVSFSAAFISRSLFEYLDNKNMLPAWITRGAPLPDLFTIDEDGFVRRVMSR